MAYYIGLMSGTSMDAVDAALLDLSDNQCQLIANHSHPMPVELKRQLQQLIHDETFNVRDFGSLDIALGRLFATAANQLIKQTGMNRSAINAIGSHGQTVFHAPDQEPPFTLQIGDPNTIAQLTGITTVADFRRRDMAAGGQGAPLVPAFHEQLFRSKEQDRVILNMGGIANVTILPADPARPVLGFDTGPGNCLLDDWILKQRGEAFDKDGAWGATGSVNSKLLAELLSDPYFSAPPPKSTGREYFNLEWLQRFSIGDEAAENIQATLVQLTVESIAAAIDQHASQADELYLCGGGAYNPQLAQGLAQHLSNLRVATTAELGVAPEWVEAAAFAWLAKQTLEGKPGNLTEVTGAGERVILGAIYPCRK